VAMPMAMPVGGVVVPVVMIVIVRVVRVRHGAYVSPHRGGINAQVCRPGPRRGG
jgi:hypothetical protein